MAVLEYLNENNKWKKVNAYGVSSINGQQGDIKITPESIGAPTRDRVEKLNRKLDQKIEEIWYGYKDIVLYSEEIVYEGEGAGISIPVYYTSHFNRPGIYTIKLSEDWWYSYYYQEETIESQEYELWYEGTTEGFVYTSETGTLFFMQTAHPPAGTYEVQLIYKEVHAIPYDFLTKYKLITFDSSKYFGFKLNDLDEGQYYITFADSSDKCYCDMYKDADSYKRYCEVLMLKSQENKIEKSIYVTGDNGNMTKLESKIIGQGGVFYQGVNAQYFYFYDSEGNRKNGLSFDIDGNIRLTQNKRIENVSTPFGDTDVANKKYVDDAVAVVTPAVYKDVTTDFEEADFDSEIAYLASLTNAGKYCCKGELAIYYSDIVIDPANSHIFNTITSYGYNGYKIICNYLNNQQISIVDILPDGRFRISKLQTARVPILYDDVTNKKYVDDAIANALTTIDNAETLSF